MLQLLTFLAIISPYLILIWNLSCVIVGFLYGLKNVSYLRRYKKEEFQVALVLLLISIPLSAQLLLWWSNQ